MTNKVNHTAMGPLHIFLVCHPGLEPMLSQELAALDLPGLSAARTTLGGVEVQGDWQAVWRLNLMLRGCTRVLVRVAEFSAVHLSQLDKRARKIEWLDWLAAGQTVQVEASAKRSKLYHSGAVAQRVMNAAVSALDPGHGDAVGQPEEAGSDPQSINLMVRIEKDWCSVSIDTSGAPLYKRGGKQAVGKAPMRETLASLFLRSAGYQAGEALLDPMCGSGTFVLEAAGLSAGQVAGAHRDFAFQRLPTFNQGQFAQIVSTLVAEDSPAQTKLFFGADRDAGAIDAAQQNAGRMGLGDIADFAQGPISELARPECSPGLVIVNPPYGDRIGNKRDLTALYATFGKVLRERFSGWRVAVITNEESLAKACGLPFQKPGPVVSHGGLKVRLWQSAPLPQRDAQHNQQP